MTNQEQYDLIKKICGQIRASLQKESERLEKVAEGWKDKSPAAYCNIREQATSMVKAQIVVTGVETKLEFELFEKATEDDGIKL